jgi:putative flippase GtrA
MKGHLKRVAFFVGVGSAAALTHLGVVVALVELIGMPPLIANCGGWMVAFTVSFVGHARLTFGDQDAPTLRAMRRFFLVSAAGFAVNQGAYALLLGHTGLRYDLALAAVLVAVALATYLLGRYWAFRGQGARS